MENHVEIRGLAFVRGERKILDRVDIAIPRNKITAIMGPSGSGKTTLLRLMCAQLFPTAGEVLFNGKNIHELNRKALYQLRQSIGMLFQSGALFTHMSVFDNVAFALREHTNLPEDMLRDHVLLKLEAVGLRGAARLMPGALSGGMNRRVALARAIAMDPSMIMYDEPFAGQDPITMGVLLKLIKRLNQALGLTSVIVSHDVQEAASIADYLYVIAGGKVIGHGEPETVLASDVPELKQFLQGLPDGVVPFHYPAVAINEELL